MKRFISVLLMLAMTLAMLPTSVFASEENQVSESYTYVFTNAAHTGSSTASALCNFEANKVNQGLHTIETTVANVSSPWGYVAQSFPHTVAGIGTEVASARLSYYRPGKKAENAVVFDPQSSEIATALCLEIEVKNGGEFIPTLNYSKFVVGPIVDLYIVPQTGDALTNATLSDYVKELDKKYYIGTVDSYGNGGSGSDKFAPISLSSGNYYFIMIPNGENVAIQESGNTRTFHYFLPVSLNLSPRGLQLTATLDQTTLEIGEKTTISTSVAMSDGGELPGTVSYNYSSKNPGIANVDAEGNVTAVSDGVTEIAVVASCGSLKSTKKLSIKVTKPLPDAPSYTYDFNQIDGKTSDSLTLDYENAGYDNTNGTWSYVNVSGTPIKTVSVYGIYINMYDTEDFGALKLNIPYAGKYNAKLLYHQNAKTGGVGDVFLLPASADISNVKLVDANTDKINLFTDVCYFNTETDPVNKYDVEASSENISIPEAGEYYIIFRSTGTRSGSYGQYPHKVILEGKDSDASAVMYATVSTSRKEIKPGENAKVLVEGWMNNGESLSSDVTYTYKASDNSVISIDEKGNITGIKDGRVTIETTLSVGEHKKTYEVPFIVDSTEKTGYTVVYDIANVAAVNAAAKPQFTSMSLDSNNGFWGYISNSQNQDTPDWAFSYTNSGLCIGQNRWASFMINVPVEGVYTMYIEHGMHKEGCDTGVYVSDGDKTDSPVDDAYFVGSFNTLDDNADDYKTLNSNPSYIANVSLKKGLNRVAFRAPKSSGNAFAVAGNIILDGGDKTLLMYADMEISDGGKISLSGKMSDGSAADLTRASVRYQSSDSDIVEVPHKGNALIVKALGEVTITAEIALGDAVVFAEKELNITKLPESFPGIDVEYNFYEKSGAWDPVNNPPEGFGGSNYPGDIRGITYQYTGVNGVGNWQYGMVGGTKSWTPTNSQIFMYAGSESDPTKYLRLQLPKVEDWVALDIKIPAKGRYIAEFLHSVQGTYATKSDIYIIPKDETTDTPEEITALLKTTEPLGTANYYDQTTSTYKAKTIELGELQFEAAGEYRLVFKRCKDSVFGYDFPKKLTLYGKNQMHYTDIYLDKQMLEFGETTKINITATRLDGSVLDPSEYTITASSSDSSVASVSGDGVITGKGDGIATISVKVEDAFGNVVSSEFAITATDNTDITASELEVKSPIYVDESTNISWNLTKQSGNIVTISPESISYEFSEDGIVSIGKDGIIKGIKAGTVEITANATFRDSDMTAKASVEVLVDDRKSEPTYYTYEKREAILENVEKYAWAKAQMKSSVNQADKYLDSYMTIYEQLPGEGLPRGARASLKTDPYAYFCRYCGTDLTAKYAGGLNSGFSVNVLTKPWKIQCQECKRIFPSNDFESFYELGRDRQGYFDVERARMLHHEMLFHKNGESCTCEVPKEEFSDEWYEFYGYGNPEGYLYNELYPELRDSTKPTTYNIDPRTKEAIDGKRWGVDDGFGYKPGRMASETCEEIHTYIAVYNRQLHSEMEDALLYFTRAYLYSGDVKYGRAGAILTDRLADLYPSYDLESFGGINYAHNDGNRGVGKIFGCIGEANYTQRNALACDAFFTVLSDPQVISFLSSEAQRRGLENDKSTPEKIWDNWERGILDEIYYAMQRRQINGNFGMKQNALASAAIVRDREPLTTEMIKWIYTTDTVPNDWHKATGGDLMTQLIDVVDRDGVNNESNPNYNAIIIQNLYVVAEILSYYKGEGDYNLYENPKFAELFVGLIPFFTTENKTLAIGDGGGTANVGGFEYITYYYDAFDYLKDTVYGPQIANYMYMRNGFTAEGLNYGIFKKNPERLEKEVLERITPDVKAKSENLTGYGLAILRDGIRTKKTTSQTETNTLRDAWIYYGGTHMSHKHRDTLTLGMDAYGFDIAPDLGEPEQKTYQPNRFQWVKTTISHNTVLVNEKEQPNYTVNGNPLHFEDAGAVKVMDIEAPGVYNETSQYRRTVVMVEASDDVSYSVDFFRVKGGKHHTYSFHSQAENAVPLSGLDFTTKWDEEGNYITGAQVAKETGEYTMSFWNEKSEFVTEPVMKQAGEYIGSYADIALEPGQDPNSPWVGTYETVYPRGYSWFSKVRRDTELENGNFSVEFDVKDYRKASTNSDGVKLRMTQLNDFTPDEVVIAAGYVPNRTANLVMPRTLDYVLVTRESDDKELDTLYTTVFEPYKTTPYISDMKAVDISTNNTVGNDDIARAVKVVHTNGRVDYVIHATNNNAIYTITDGEYSFDFRGAIGVLSKKSDSPDANVIYRYVIDGDMIGGETNGAPSYVGTIADFTKDLSFDNYIDVNLDCDNVGSLVGRFINVKNDGVRNGSFEIEGAEKISESVIRLDIGTTSLIRGHKDKNDFSSGYVYDITENQKFTIPMSYVDEKKPIVKNPGILSVSAGSQLTLSIDARSQVEGTTLEYLGTGLPRGAILDKESGELVWKPTSSQIGNNHISVTVRDSDGRESTIHFTVAVYGATTGGTQNPSTPAGGNGGGGSATTPTTPTEPEKEEVVIPETPATTERFVDLTSHAWAKDAINALAEDGVIKGTSENTFSPAANITRADFTILLVRAFKLESENTENFADVSDNDYFAKELAIARNTGIVNGIGDNKYAPRNTITRQDMMVIVYRAMQKLGVELEAKDVEYADFDDVADYAKEAVSALITAGLVNGKGGKIAPTDYTTRAEVAVLIKRILDYKK